MLHGDVIVASVTRAFAAAVAQQHGLIALVAETQFTDRQLEFPDGAGFRPSCPLSPSSLAVQSMTLLSFPVQQSAHHMLELALSETLEHQCN